MRAGLPVIWTGAASWRHWRCGRHVLLCVLLLLGGVSSVGGQQPKPAENTPPPDQPPPVRRLFFPVGQAAKLVPDGFRPVDAERLRTQLDDRDGLEQPSGPMLVHALYFVTLADEVLYSGHSSFDFADIRRDEETVEVGATNLAISGDIPNSRDLLQHSRLATSPDGQLTAILESDEKIDWTWERAAEPGSSTELRSFVLELPQAPRSTLYLQLPKEHALECGDAPIEMVEQQWFDQAGLTEPQQRHLRSIATQYSGMDPPDFRWWRIDAGGIGRLKLDIRRIDESGSQQPLHCTDWDVDYRVDESDITWNARLQLIAAQPTEIPDLVVPEESRVISIRVNGRAVGWVERKRQRGMTHLQISPSASLDEGNASIIVQGVSPLEIGARTRLPNISIDDDQIMALVPTIDARLQVDSPIETAELQLPDAWRIHQTERSESNSAEAMILQLAGPVTDAAVEGLFLRAKKVAHGAAACQLVLGGATASCTMTVDALVEDFGNLPLRFDIQPGWSVTDVTFLASEAGQQLANYQLSAGTLAIWPADVSNPTLRFVVRGERPLIRDEENDQMLVAPTWFARPHNARLDTYYSIESLRDFGFTLHESERVTTAVTELPDSLQSLVASQNASPRYYKIPRFGTLSEITVHPQAGERKVQSITTAQLRNGRIRQRFEMAIESQKTDFDVLRVRIDGSPTAAIRWQLRSRSEDGQMPARADAGAAGRGDAADMTSAPAPIPATARRVSAEGQSVWEIELPPQFGSALTVLGECYLPLDGSAFAVGSPEARGSGPSAPINLGLPDVLDVDDQEGTVQLGPGLRVASSSLEEGIEQVQLPGTPDGVSHLRYQPSRHTSLTVTRYPEGLNRDTFAWRHGITQFISASLSDRIESTIEISGTSPFRVRFPARFVFQELVVNGAAIAPASIDRAAGRLVVPGGEKTRRVQIRWQRNRGGNRMVQLWSPAAVHLDLPTLETSVDYQLIDRSAMLWPMRLRVSPGPKENRSLERMVLMQPSLALCLVIAVALLAALLGWNLAPRFGIAVRVAAILLLSVGLLFSGVPALAALLSSVALATACFVRQLHAHLEATTGGELPASSRTSTVTAAVSLYSLMIALTAAGGLATVGGATPRPIPVLIPVERDGTVAGSKVYLAERDYERLFRLPPAEENRSPYLVHRATHRIDLGKVESDGTTLTVPAQSDYTIENVHDADYLDLQLNPSIVRQVRVADAEDLRLIRLVRMEDRVRLYDLPAGVWQISISMVVPIQQETDSQASRLQLDVLPSHRASAVVDYPTSLDAPMINQQFARRPSSSSSRTIVRMLGAVPTLQLNWRKSIARPQTVAWRGIQWNRLGARQLSEEFQVLFSDTPPATGQSITLRVARAQTPIVTTPDWRLDAWVPISDNVWECTLTPTRPTTQRPTLIWLTDLDPAAAEIQLTPVNVFNTAGTQIPVDYLGLSHAEFWTVEEMLGWREIEPTTFYSAWSGIRRDVSLALSPLSPDTSLELSRNPEKPTHVSENHRLAIMPDADLLRYEATIYPGQTGLPSVTLRIPPDLDVSSVRVNGRENFDAVHSGPLHQLLVVRGLFGSEPVTVVVEGRIGNSQRSNRRPPRIAISGEVEESTYEVTRHPSVTVTGIDAASRRFVVQPFEIPSNELLRNLTIPVVRWQLDNLPETALALPISLGKAPAAAGFDCTIVTNVTWDGSRWLSEATLKIRGGDAPRVLRLDLPAEWTAELATDADAMLLGPDTGSARRALRLAVRPEEGQDASTVTITARRSSANSDQITAPLIEVPEAQSARRVYFLPSKLTTRTLRWHTPALRRLPADELPPALKELAPDKDAMVFVGPHAAPAPVLVKEFGSVVIEQFAAICDVRLYETYQETRWALVGWDIQPSNNNGVRIRIAPDCHVESVWAADKPAVWSQRDGIVDVQLNLSQLAQRVRMLVRIEGRPDDWIPTLLHLPTRVTTVAIMQTGQSRFAPAVDLGRGRWTRIGESTWRRIRADAILALLQSSADGAASRSIDEIAGWLQPWEQRFRSAVQETSEQDPAESESLTSRLGVLQDQMDSFVDRLAGAAVRDRAQEDAQSPVWTPRAIYVQRGETQSLAVQPATDARSFVTILLAVLGFCAAVYWFGLKQIASENQFVADGILTACAAVLALPVLPWPVLLLPVLTAVAVLTRHGYWSQLRMPRTAT